MENIRVWTKQHENAARLLEETGRYFGRREYVGIDLGEDAPLVLEAYNWLVSHGPLARAPKPPEAEYPVWVSFRHEDTMLHTPHTVILELSVDPSLVTEIDINKWGTILNYGYIPADEKDRLRHRRLLEDYGVSDAKAYMSQFYPQIRREIIASWDRLFDPSVSLGNGQTYGVLWEVRKEWVTNITR